MLKIHGVLWRTITFPEMKIKSVLIRGFPFSVEAVPWGLLAVKLLVTQSERHLIKNVEKWKIGKELNRTVFRLPPFLFSLWFKTCNYVLNGVAAGLGVRVIRKSRVADEAFLFPLEKTIIRSKIKSHNYLLLIWIWKQAVLTIFVFQSG